MNKLPTQLQWNIQVKTLLETNKFCYKNHEVWHLKREEEKERKILRAKIIKP